MSAMLAMITTTRIVRLIAIAITRIASTIIMIAIARAIIINQKMVPKRTIMPCTLMLATKQAGITRDAPLTSCTQCTPLPLFPPPAAGPDLVRTTTLLTKDATVLSP